MKPVIETHGLCKSYGGRTVVDHLDLTVAQGCVLGFLGPNGAGQSTTMKMLLGLTAPTKGSFTINGKHFPDDRLEILKAQNAKLSSSREAACPAHPRRRSSLTMMNPQ